VRVTDENGGTTEQTITVNVAAVEDEAVITAEGGSGAEDTVITGSIEATDVDGAITGIELVSGTANGTVALNEDGTYTFTPNEDWNGSDSFVVRVTDENGGTTEQTITVNVTAVDDGTTITGDRGIVVSNTGDYDPNHDDGLRLVKDFKQSQVRPR